MVLLIFLSVFFVGCGHQFTPAESTVPLEVSQQPLPIAIPKEMLLYRSFFLHAIQEVWGAEPAGTFFGQVHQESSWQANAQSAYAKGLTQFTNETAAWIQGLYPNDLGQFCANPSGCPLDPKWALTALVQYDNRLYTAVAWADPHKDRLAIMLAGYNGGPGWITKERKLCVAPSCQDTRWFNHVEIHCLRSPDACRENRDYPQKILNKWAPLYQQYLTR